LADRNEASRSRLSSARRRIDAFIEQIDVLGTSNFPHDDGKDALSAIRKHCLDLRRNLEMPVGTNPEVIDRMCLQLSDEVSDYTGVLGIILRSTHVRNPFELHHVLKDILNRALGPDTSLVISSEWEFTPFTYPMTLDLLPEFVFIGSPAPESGNPMLIPLAGHEIGHSAWRTFDCLATHSTAVAGAVDAELVKNTTAHSDLLRRMPLASLQASLIKDRCTEHAMKQLEEVFCDLFGLYIFGEGYVAAFDYLLGPGAYDRDLNYPSDATRIRFLQDALSSFKITVEPSLFQFWSISKSSRDDQSTAAVVDAVVEQLVPLVRADLQVRMAPIFALPNEIAVKAIADSFRRGQPFGDKAEIGEIVTAGWKELRHLDAKSCTDLERRKSYRVLNDLVLKTVEVAEYHDRLSTNA
jgi:hypothetical protein